MFRQQRVATRGVDEVSGSARSRVLPVASTECTTGSPSLGNSTCVTLISSQHLRALLGAVAQQQVIEFRTPDFVGVRMVLVERKGKVELVMAADFHIGVEVCARFLDTDRVDLIQYAESLQDRQVHRQQATRRYESADAVPFPGA